MLIHVEELNEKEELKFYSERSEVQLLRANEPEPGYFCAESLKVIERALHAGYEPLSFLAEPDQAEKQAELFARYPSVPLYVAPPQAFREIVGYSMMRGIAALMKRKILPDAAELLKAVLLKAEQLNVEQLKAEQLKAEQLKAEQLKEKARIVILDRVLNPVNLGSIFRNAAALGMDALLLSPGCTDPLYRRAARVSMGTVFQIPWTKLPAKTQKGCLSWPEGVLQWLKEEGVHLAAMDPSEEAENIRHARLSGKKRLALILGSEEEGVSDAVLKKCDSIVKLPMREGVDSLNVAAASAVAFWELTGEES